MTATIRFRVVFREAHKGSASRILGELPGCPMPTKALLPDIFEFDLPYGHPAVRCLCEPQADEWFVTTCEIRRKYSKKEISEWSLVHVRPTRIVSYAMDYDQSMFEFDPVNENPQLPIRQIDLVFFDEPLHARQGLVKCANGAWVCKPEFISCLAETDIQVPRITPVFPSRKQAKSWKAGRNRPADPQDPLSSLEIDVEEAQQFKWLQLHLPVGPLRIVDPAVTGSRPFRENPEEVGLTDLYRGWQILSELYLRQEAPLDGDWFLTREFIGGSGGVFLSSRPLVVSKRCFEFLRTCRLTNLAFEPANVR